MSSVSSHSRSWTKILLLPFPNNPTGAIMEREDLEAIAQILIERDIFVLSDEIYSELTYGSDHVSVAAVPGMKERTLIINGFSKAYAMTGWRLGYAAGPDWLIGQMVKIHQYAIMCAPTTSQYAAVGLQCFEPKGAFYIFPNISRLGMTSEAFATRLLEEEKVAVVPGTAFGDCGEGFIRISYAYSLEDLKEAIGRVGRFVIRHSGGRPGGAAC